MNNTAEIGFVKITSEGSVGASLRRIEAVTSYGALAYVNGIEAELRETAGLLSVPMFDVSERTASNMTAYKELQTRFKRTQTPLLTITLRHCSTKQWPHPCSYPVIVAQVDVRDPGHAL